MKRALTNLASWIASLAALVATVPSCVSGIHDGEGDVYAKKTIDVKNGGQIVLQEAVLDICAGCMKTTALVTMRRYPSVPHHAGSLSPVFEIEIPTPDTFSSEPHLTIAAAPVVAADTASMIGFLLPEAQNPQWIPDQASSSCAPPMVCGAVQLDTFMHPTSDTGLTTTTKLDFAIIKNCTPPGTQCSGQPQYYCTAGACQECLLCGP